MVRNGPLPARTITTGVGPIKVQQPRVHDRRSAARREKFPSAILPPYLRQTKGIEELIPWLYLKGVSTGDCSEALAVLQGPDAQGLSATTVTRLTGLWQKEYRDWNKRPLAGKHYVYVWADGVYFTIRLEGGRQCVLVLLGATADGQKELIAITSCSPSLASPRSTGGTCARPTPWSRCSRRCGCGRTRRRGAGRGRRV